MASTVVGLPGGPQLDAALAARCSHSGVDVAENVSFRALSLRDWRQFAVVDLEFDSALTVLTGSNGAGKTSLLNLLSPHFSWSSQFLQGAASSRLPARSANMSDRLHEHEDINPGWETIGTLTYSNGIITPILLPRQPAVTNYNLQLPQQQVVPGLNLPSHRMVMGRTAVPTIPTTFSASDQLLEGFLAEIRQRYAGGYSVRPPGLVMKEALLAAQMYGEASESRAAVPEAAAIWHGFQAVLRDVLPSSIAFRKLRVDSPELVLETETGDFALDSASGGLSAIFELSWQIFLRARQYSDFTVCLDEPENHLHPEMQRSLMPSLLRAFPHIRFVIATHSPFIVTSVATAKVYALDYIDGRVNSRLLDSANLGGDSDETLRDVLGLESTLPKWAEARLTELSERYLTKEPSADDLRALRGELQALGMASRYPAAVARAMEQLDAPAD